MSTSKKEPESFGEAFKIELAVFAVCVAILITMLAINIFKIQHPDKASINRDVKHLIAAYSDCQSSKIECVAALEGYAKANKMQQAYPRAINALKEANQI